LQEAQKFFPILDIHNPPEFTGTQVNNSCSR
jgi:hypothetical protein